MRRCRPLTPPCPEHLPERCSLKLLSQSRQMTMTITVMMLAAVQILAMQIIGHCVCGPQLAVKKDSAIIVIFHFYFLQLCIATVGRLLRNVIREMTISLTATLVERFRWYAVNRRTQRKKGTLTMIRTIVLAALTTIALSSFAHAGCVGAGVGDACVGIPTPTREHREVYEHRRAPVIIEHHEHHSAPVVIERHDEDDD